MILNFTLVIILVTLTNKTKKPLIPALIYAGAKTALGAALYFLFYREVNEYPILDMVVGFCITFIIAFGLAYLVSWILQKYEGKTWAYILATVCILPTFLI